MNRAPTLGLFGAFEIPMEAADLTISINCDKNKNDTSADTES